jgi:hypothetical protein
VIFCQIESLEMEKAKGRKKVDDNKKMPNSDLGAAIK